MVWSLAELASELRVSYGRPELRDEAARAMANAAAVDDILTDMLVDPEFPPGSLAYNALARRRVMLLSTSSDLYLAQALASDVRYESVSGCSGLSR